MDDNQVWFVSDQHFWHKNIIDYTSRGDHFTSLEEMHNDLIKAHNAKTGKKDRVFCLGDFSFGNKEQTTEVVRQLKGELYLVMGNHDKSRSAKWWRDCGFKNAFEYPIIYDGFWVLSHEPMEFLNHHMPYVNIHGHLHDESYEGLQRINVSVERTFWRPISFEGIKTTINLVSKKESE